MLLECLQENKLIAIDDHMVDPKTNSFLEEKINFIIRYTTPHLDKDLSKRLQNKTSILVDNLSLNSEKDLNIEQLEMVSQNLDKMDEIQKVEEQLKLVSLGGQQSPTHVRPKSMIDLSSGDFLQNAIGKATLSLAQVAFNPNMIIEDKSQCIFVTKEDEDKDLHELKEQEKNLKSYFEQTRFKNKDKEITSWQIRVNIIELKHILGNNEHIFCTVEYEDQLFKTKTMPIDCLKFNELFSHRIEKMKSDKFYYSVIKVSVYYYRSFYKSHVLIGIFEIDAGTVYKQPSHEFYRKWGLIHSVGDDCIKGYIKCDIIVQGKGGESI